MGQSPHVLAKHPIITSDLWCGPKPAFNCDQGSHHEAPHTKTIHTKPSSWSSCHTQYQNQCTLEQVVQAIFKGE